MLRVTQSLIHGYIELQVFKPRACCVNSMQEQYFINFTIMTVHSNHIHVQNFILLYVRSDLMVAVCQSLIAPNMMYNVFVYFTIAIGHDIVKNILKYRLPCT